MINEDLVAWLDTETTGLSAEKNDIIQLAFILTRGKEILAKAQFTCCPFSLDNCNPYAMKVHGYSIEGVRKFPNAIEVQEEVELFFRAYQRGHEDKITLAGYNVPFDVRFFKAWLEKGDRVEVLPMLDYKSYDVFPLAKAYCMARGINLPNHKLTTMCEHFGISLDAHDAMNDIEATYKLNEILTKAMEKHNENV